MVHSHEDGEYCCIHGGHLVPRDDHTTGAQHERRLNLEPFPAIAPGGDRYPSFGSASIALNAKTKQVGAAFQVAKAWSIDPEGAMASGSNSSDISVVSSAALTSSYVNQPDPYFADSQAYWKVATEAYTHITWQPPENTTVNQANGILGTDITGFLRGQSANAFLSKLAGDLRSQIRGAK